jgi:hypothetical protein
MRSSEAAKGGGRAAPRLGWQWAQKDGCAQRTGAHARPKPTSLSYIYLGSSVCLSSCHIPVVLSYSCHICGVWRGDEPKNTGARSARARTRGQNPLVIKISLVKKLSSLNPRRAWQNLVRLLRVEDPRGKVFTPWWPWCDISWLT